MSRTLTLADVTLGLLQVSVLREAQAEITEPDPETGDPVVIQEARPMRLRFKRAYRVVDAGGAVIPEIPSSEIRVDVDFDQLPITIQQALVAINTYTLARAREDAGLT